MVKEVPCPYCFSIGLKPLPVDSLLEEFHDNCYFCLTCGRHHINLKDIKELL